MAVIVDSSVFIAMERRGWGLDSLMPASSDEPTALAAITASELLAGAYLADSTERRLRREAFVEAILDGMPSLPFDLVVAQTHAKLWVQLRELGQLTPGPRARLVARGLAYPPPSAVARRRIASRVLPM